MKTHASIFISKHFSSSGDGDDQYTSSISLATVGIIHTEKVGGVGGQENSGGVGLQGRLSESRAARETSQTLRRGRERETETTRRVHLVCVNIM